MRVTSRLAIRVFHLYFKDFIGGNVKVFDMDKSLTPQPPLLQRGGVLEAVCLGNVRKGDLSVGVPRISFEGVSKCKYHFDNLTV